MPKITCGSCSEKYYDWQNHKCEPAWIVRFEDWEPEDTTIIHAPDPQRAAEKYHEKYFEAIDYDTDVTVIVTDARDEHTWKVAVTAMQAIEFAGQVTDQTR